MSTQFPTAKEFQALGYPEFIAEALAANGLSAGWAKSASTYEIMDYALQWAGIIGFTNSIISSVRFLDERKSR